MDDMDNIEKHNPPPARPRSAIIADMASLDLAVRGKLTEKKRRLADGTTQVYYNLQRWEDGKNHTTYVPGHLADAVSSAIAEGRRLDALAEELSASDTRTVLSGGAGKKKRPRSSRS